MAKKHAAEQAAANGDRLVKVQAVTLGYYDHIRRRPGDVFLIPEKWADAKWLQRVDPNTPERTTGPSQALRREHDSILSGKNFSGILTGPDDVPANIPNGTDNPLGAD